MPKRLMSVSTFLLILLVLVSAFFIFMVTPKWTTLSNSTHPTLIHQAGLVGFPAFREAALRSPHLISIDKGGWANELDAVARGHTSIDSARDSYIHGLIMFDDTSKFDQNCSQLPSCTMALLPPLPLRPLFDLMFIVDVMCVRSGWRELAALPWKIAVLQNTIENGYPHTIADIICLPVKFAVGSCGNPDSKNYALKVLLHEKIHVLQRNQPDLAYKYIFTNLKYVRHCRRTHIDPQLSLRTRSNPDLDDWIYIKRSTHRMENGTITTLSMSVVMVYSSDNPKSLKDCKIVPMKVSRGHTSKTDTNIHVNDETMISMYEHPFEEMAYTLSDSIIENSRLQKKIATL